MQKKTNSVSTTSCWFRLGIFTIGLTSISIGAFAEEPAYTPPPYMGLQERAGGADELSDEQQIKQLLAYYTRTLDAGDIEGFRKIFSKDVVTKTFARQADGSAKLMSPPTYGIDGIANIFKNLQKFASENMPPMKDGFRSVPRSHHFTHNPIIEIRGDTATMNSQYLVTLAIPSKPTLKPGHHGQTMVVLSGYYDQDFKKINGKWLITEHRVLTDVDYTMPGVDKSFYPGREEE